VKPIRPSPPLRRSTLVVGQGGGPTAVVNASLAGVVDEALRHPTIDGIYGMRYGLRGLLREDLVDLRRESPATLAQLRVTPSAALGSSRHVLTGQECERVIAVLRAHQVRYFLFIGGNGSAGAALQIGSGAAAAGFDLQVVCIPKTVDNDVVGTDHTPGYPSVARWLAIAVRDAGLDSAAIGQVDAVKVIETMGRDAGWIAASTAAAREREGDAPHLIYLPERPVAQARFLADVERVHRTHGHVVVVVAEGVKDERGEYLAASRRPVDLDPAGQPQLGGAASVLAALIATNLGLKARVDKPGTIQRVAGMLASPVDIDEAYRVGVAAVQYALAGERDAMVTLLREPGPDYRTRTGLVPLAEVVRATRPVPDAFIAETGNDLTSAFLDYVRPLIGGPLPPYARLAAVQVARRLPLVQDTHPRD